MVAEVVHKPGEAVVPTVPDRHRHEDRRHLTLTHDGTTLPIVGDVFEMSNDGIVLTHAAAGTTLEHLLVAVTDGTDQPRTRPLQPR